MLKYRISFVLGIILAAFCLVSCAPLARSGPVQTETEEVSLEGAEQVQVQIRMGAGELVIGGGADQLLEGEFSYSDKDLRPDISYRVLSSGAGSLEIEQGENPGNRLYDSYYNRWELDFNSEVPLEIEVALGAGESTLDLGDLTLRSFSLQVGAGQAHLDLGQGPSQDLELDIEGGVGELTVILPRNVRIEADVSGGLGEVNTSGLIRENGRYLSEYDGAGPIIRIFIEAGIGELNLLVQ